MDKQKLDDKSRHITQFNGKSKSFLLNYNSKKGNTTNKPKKY